MQTSCVKFRVRKGNYLSTGRNHTRKQPTQMEPAESSKSAQSQGGGMIFLIHLSLYILFA